MYIYRYIYMYKYIYIYICIYLQTDITIVKKLATEMLNRDSDRKFQRGGRGGAPGA